MSKFTMQLQKLSIQQVTRAKYEKLSASLESDMGDKLDCYYILLYH